MHRHPTPAAEKIEAEARLLVGTPYRHLGRDMSGMDWLGFIQACVEAATGRDKPAPEDYAADWKCGLPVEAAAELFDVWGLDEIPLNVAKPGDIILFAMPTAHAAVLIAGPVGAKDATIAHAYWGKAACASYLAGWWRKRADRAFRLHVAANAPARSGLRLVEQVAA